MEVAISQLKKMIHQRVTHRSCIRLSKKLFQSLFLAANREEVVSLSIFAITQNLDPFYDVLVEPLGCDTLLIEYHGI